MFLRLNLYRSTASAAGDPASGVVTRNSLIYGNGRIVATIGVEELVIVDTHDVVLICPRSRVQDVKAMVAMVREQHGHLL